MSELSVGKEVLSYCNKCKLALAHLIVVMKTKSTIGKVKCKTCAGTHAYKDPSKVKVKKATTSRLKNTRTTSKQSVSDIWMDALNKATEKSKPYSPKSKFDKGDVIDHPKFGPGIIDRVIDSDKIEVVFRHEIKTLIHNK